MTGRSVGSVFVVVVVVVVGEGAALWAAYDRATGNLQVELRCGQFTHLGDSPIGVTWQVGLLVVCLLLSSSLLLLFENELRYGQFTYLGDSPVGVTLEVGQLMVCVCLLLLLPLEVELCWV